MSALDLPCVRVYGPPRAAESVRLVVSRRGRPSRPVLTKACEGLGCKQTVSAFTPQRLRARRFCSPECHYRSRSAPAPILPPLEIRIGKAPLVVDCPDNNLVHRIARDQQLALIDAYLAKERTACP